MRVLDAIFLQATSCPTRPAIALVDRIVTYDMLARGVLAVERRSKLSGIRPGDVVAVALTSPIRHIIVTLALLRLGAISVSIDEPDAPSAQQLQANWTFVEDFEDVADKSHAHLVTDDWFHGFDGPFNLAAPAHSLDDDEVCRLIMSSGTTGMPKPLAFTPHILANRIYTRIALNADCSPERTLMAVPITSQMGWIGALASLAVGGMILFAITPETTLQMIDLYGVTNLVATANQISDLLAFKEKNDFPTNSLRALQVGGGLLSASLTRRLQSEFCHKIVCRYGSTETGIVAYADAKALTAHQGAVGLIAPWARGEVVDEDGAPLPPGSEGILRVRTDTLAQPWQRGMAYVSPGDLWFCPGDIGMIDERGMMFARGRLSNVLNVGGVKVLAEQVEALLAAQSNVREAGVFSVIGESGFEEIWGVVAGEHVEPETVRVAVNEKLPHTPVTRLLVAPSLPRSTNGKLLRSELRKIFID